MTNTIGERISSTVEYQDKKTHICYKNTDHAISSNIKQQQRVFIEMAKREALKSTMQHKHGCVIVKRNKIISIAHNVVHKSNDYSIHAEVNALHKINKHSKTNIKDCVMYVVRVNDSDLFHLKYSKPCINCENCIKIYGIRKIFYSIST